MRHIVSGLAIHIDFIIVFLVAALIIMIPACGGSGGGGEKGPALGVNVWLVDIDDYTGSGDPNLGAIINEFKRLFKGGGIDVSDVVVHELKGADAERLTFIDITEDLNNNKIPDKMETLFQLSSSAKNVYLNIFFVKVISPLGTLGLSSMIPGPGENGAISSGVLINTFGGLTHMSSADLQLQGETIAHESGHYLGLYHTSERSGLIFDPLSDTPECKREINDLNGDRIVDTGECRDLDGPNLMFWQAAKYAQDTISGMQTDAIKAHPLVMK